MAFVPNTGGVPLDCVESTHANIRKAGAFGNVQLSAWVKVVEAYVVLLLKYHPEFQRGTNPVEADKEPVI